MFQRFGSANGRGICPSPDNLKSGAKRACRYEPDVNPAYQDFTEHYGVAILRARVRKPRDKVLTSYCLL